MNTKERALRLLNTLGNQYNPSILHIREAYDLVKQLVDPEELRQYKEKNDRISAKIDEALLLARQVAAKNADNQ